jgi:ATP-dependent helicase/nuclease subunit B
LNTTNKGGGKMSLQFILGTGRKDHQTALVDETLAWMDEDPKHEVFFLVPNYSKFEQEQEFLAAVRAKEQKKTLSTTKIQVFSFYRLAWYFLQQTTLLSGSELSEAGSAMLLRQVLAKRQEELTVFRGEINKKGFIKQLQDLYNELQTGNITPDDLIVQGIETPKQEDQRLKMQDLQLIFNTFEEEMLIHGVQSENQMTLLANYLSQQDLSHIKFIVSGFSQLNAQEYQLLRVLMERGHLTIDLLLDKAYPATPPEPLDLFYSTGQIYFRLKQAAAEARIPVYLDKHAPDKPLAQAITSLQEVWEETSSQKRRQEHSLGKQQDLRLWEAETPTEEIRQAAVEIRRLVSEEGYRYRDIQILTKSMDLYSDLIQPIFEEMAIPYYVDEDQLMESHPLVEFINSLFAMDRSYYRLRDIMRFFKTELFLPPAENPQSLEEWLEQRDLFRQRLDLAENAALAYNYQGNQWLQDKEWRFIAYDFEEDKLEDVRMLEQQANLIRRQFQETVPAFFEKIKKSKTGQEAASVFYRFLVTSGVQEQLIFWRNQEIERGDLAAARNHEQTWGALIDLLDEYAVIYEEEPFDWASFQEIITSGLENLSYGKIPTAIDQVRINRLELVRANQAKVTIAVGLNDQVFPDRTETKGLLSSEERQLLNDTLEEGKYLFDPAKETMSMEPFRAYLVFNSASQHLYLSYAQSYDTDRSLKMSPYLRRISEYLSVPVEKKEHLTLKSKPEAHVGTYKNLIDELNRVYRIAADEKQAIPTVWQQLKDLVLHSQWREFALRIFESQTHLNVPVALPTELAEELYGKDIYTSISRMESFYHCEYKYFVQFGLKLKERSIYGLTPAATGDFYHESLDRFFKLLFSNQVSLVEMTDKQREAFTEKVLEDVFGELKFEILASSARMNYIRYQLGQTIQKVVWALQRQSKNTGLHPLQTEILFGQIAGAKGITGLELPLSNGGKLHVRGKIDRVDVANDQDETWLSVVDYKSSGRSFDVTEAYYGMAMQLLTYLDVALMDAVHLTGQAAVKPAGSYYLHVHNPVLSEAENVDKETLKKFSYDGLFVDDPGLLEVLDHSLEAKENSLIYPVKKNAKEQYQKGSYSKEKFFTEEELQMFMAHNRKKMRLAGDAITSGEIKLNPSYKDKQRIACQTCPFRSVCTFDVMLKENNYQRLEKLNKEEALRRMMEGSDEE